MGRQVPPGLHAESCPPRPEPPDNHERSGRSRGNHLHRRAEPPPARGEAAVHVPSGLPDHSVRVGQSTCDMGRGRADLPARTRQLTSQACWRDSSVYSDHPLVAASAAPVHRCPGRRRGDRRECGRRHARLGRQQSTQHSQLTASTLSTMTAQSTMVLSKVVIAQSCRAPYTDRWLPQRPTPPRSSRETASSLNTSSLAPSRLDGRSSSPAR